MVNLNCSEPPSAVGELAGGPLFAGQQQAPSSDALRVLANEWLDHLLAVDLPPGQLRLDWHLGEMDFTGPVEGVSGILDRALAGRPIVFVLDRPRRPILLAEGMDRRHPAVLLAVGLHLPRLAVQTGATEADRFLKKLGSLAQLALSAAGQKRAYLRRTSADSATAALAQGFLLDRARLLVTPIGLDAVVRMLSGKGLTGGGAALDLGKQIVQRLRDVLRQEGRLVRLEACLDGPLAEFPPVQDTEAEQVPGLTPWDCQSPLKSQWRAAGTLHAVAERGTLLLHLAAETTPAEWLDILRSIWQQTDVARVRILSRA